jgi:ubiquinone/menaquinone biosynthesis C-methylase UbiE
MRVLTLCLIWACLSPAQVAQKANEHYRTAQDRAAVMQNILGAPDRANDIKAGAIAQSLGLKPGMTVADIGSGAGILLPFLSAAVGASGHVIGEDIFDDFLAKARQTASSANLTNVGFVKGTERDPTLPASALDVAVTVDSYHHFDYPADMLAGIKRALKRGGRFVVVDYYKRAVSMGPDRDANSHIRLDKDGMIKEVEANGFVLVEVHDHVPGAQYIATFKVR